MLSVLVTLIVTVFVFGLLVAIHELGHYLVARACGVGVIEFSIGMGPVIKTWHGKYNDISIRAFPIGGFVNMVGEYDDEIPEEHKGKTPLNSKPIWQRMLIVLAGPAMNILLAFVLMFCIVASSSVIGSTTVASFMEGSVSNDYGLCAEDEILEINGKRIHCYSDMAYKIMSDGVEPVDILVRRGGSEVLLENVRFDIDDNDGIACGRQDFKVWQKNKTFGTIVYESFWQACSTVYMTADSTLDAFTGRYGIDAVGGPIAIGGQVGETIEQSVSFADAVGRIAMLAVFISVSLGICNMLPIPVLDGGRFLFYIIEAIRGKPMNKKFEQTVSAVFMLLLILLMVLVAFKDIVGLF